MQLLQTGFRLFILASVRWKKDQQTKKGKSQYLITLAFWYGGLSIHRDTCMYRDEGEGDVDVSY